jgi:MoxR-like ATPase
MRKRIAAVLLAILIAAPALGYDIRYKEQFYRLYHRQLYEYPNDLTEGIFYLEQALRADFANPLNALAVIDNAREWRRYRYLFTMHVSLKMVNLYLTLASKFDKREAYFYNAPFREQNLKSIEKAEAFYEYARTYWKEAMAWSMRLRGVPYYDLVEIHRWEDEHYRIQNGELDYGDIIDEQLARLRQVRRTFEEMDEDTY